MRRTFTRSPQTLEWFRPDTCFSSESLETKGEGLRLARTFVHDVLAAGSRNVMTRRDVIDMVDALVPRRRG
jgi:hypothetical protein